MKKITVKEIEVYVEKNIGDFHDKRLCALESLNLSKVLKRKNPYLFKAKNILTASDLIKTILDSYLSSQEETIFGDFLEGLAVFINSKVYEGRKSSAKGIDLEFDKDGKRFIISIKSGPNWGNSSQIAKMISDFKSAKITLRTGGTDFEIIAVNGCCYGRNNKQDKGDYYKYCGQRFWEFISGIDTLYTDIIKPLGYKAREKNQTFLESYSKILNRFTSDFISSFCEDGKINWERLVQFNSSK